MAYSEGPVEPPTDEKSLPIRFDTSEAPRYATNLVVQHTDHEFIISFFQVMPPLLVGPPEAKAEQVKQLTEIKGTCVGRVIVPATRMHEFVEVFKANFEKYQSKQQQVQ
jgi:hypothetical protein